MELSHDLFDTEKLKQSNTYSSTLFHTCRLDIDQVVSNIRKTSISCTLGDSWDTPAAIEKMIRAGMNILRLNLTTNTRDSYKNTVSFVRDFESLNNYTPCIAIAIDLTAVSIRTGLFKEGLDAEVFLKEGELVELTTDENLKTEGDARNIYVDTSFFPQFIYSLHRGDRIYLGDGLITLCVKEYGMLSVTCIVEEGGHIGAYQNVTLPRERVYNNAVTIKYMKDLEFSAECDADFVFTSFVDNFEMFEIARKVLPKHTKIFAKIETHDAFKRLPDIIKCADGILISRADLGLSCGSEKVFKIQKKIIGLCNVAQKPVFVIGQLVESMRVKPLPTRAEASDLANAVLDGVDGFVLTVETSSGHYPFETVRIVDQVCREAERALCYGTIERDLSVARGLLEEMTPSITGVTADSAVEAAKSSGASAIFVVTTSGASAIAIAVDKPSCAVIAVTRHPAVARYCHAFRGLYPIVYAGEKLEDWFEDMDLRITAAVTVAKTMGLVQGKDKAVFVSGSLPGSGNTNTMQIFEIPERDERRTSTLSFVPLAGVLKHPRGVMDMRVPL